MLHPALYSEPHTHQYEGAAVHMNGSQQEVLALWLNYHSVIVNFDVYL